MANESLQGRTHNVAPELKVGQTGSFALKPIIFIFGPSGVGKSYLSKRLKKNKFLYKPIDTDRKERSFEANGFPKEWDDDYHRVDFAHMVGFLRDLLGDMHAGAIVSFPTVHIFTPEKLFEARQSGASPLVLWGKHDDCIRAAEERMKKKGKKFNFSRYERLNEPTFRSYGCPEYDAFRVQGFREDGSRYPDAEYLARIMKRTGG